ncbi:MULTISPECIES: CoA ester lyase [unclassified Acidovorax]|uniref:HpcH/HpaI aldolase/citrate lyase family protein n=1 Tax=unclassified Acidovorax TaxID=2684926 RepID=UPI001C47E0CB|nr:MULTISPECIES: CoA ester lyase [unclassified Acidovorax]MBV7430749.1 CoA ester lyase [Acidovorax sp. sif0732]MBV7451855.1 CoA ester lyase [Acidovorax sp. sif0715]
MKTVRSFLFVPAANEKLLRSAVTKSSDAVILDLEDGTHPSQRPVARERLADSMGRLKAVNKLAAVRINGDWLTAVVDLKSAVLPGLDIIVLPKVEHARDVQIIAQMVTDLEAAASVPPGHVRFLLQIESAAALPHLHDIAASSPRVMGMMLGSEDYSLDCGGLPTADALLYPSMAVLTAARAARIQPIGFIASIAELGTPEDFSAVVLRARGLGFRGAVVVHPKFVDVVNECYTPTADEIQRAQRVVDAFDEAFARGEGAIKLDGAMVDKPVYLRAQELLAQL